jgi:hypothetical protein
MKIREFCLADILRTSGMPEGDIWDAYKLQKIISCYTYKTPMTQGKRADRIEDFTEKEI